MTSPPSDELPTLLHAGFLPDLKETPRFVVPGHEAGRPTVGGYSCAYCGVGDGGELVTESVGDGGPAAIAVARTAIRRTRPTQGCIKLRHSLMRQRTVFPIHVAPSERRIDGGRRSLSHEEGIARLADLLLAHRPPRARTLIYACGQIDYFTIFAFMLSPT